jgi:PAS domain S-box-containing protein
LNIVHPDDREATAAEWKRLSAGLETTRFENRCRTKDGSYRWMLWNAAPYFGQRLIYAAAHDITESNRAQAEQARLLRKAEAAEAQFRSLLELAPDAILIANSGGNVVLVNRKVEELFGYRREELLGVAEEMLIPERLRKGHTEVRLHYHAHPEIRGMHGAPHLVGRRKDGSEFPVEISLSPMQSEGEMLVIAVVRDITERQRAEEALRESEERFRTMANAAPVLIWMSGRDARCTFFNQRWLEFRGRSMEQEAGDGWAEGVHSQDSSRYLNVYRKAFDARAAFEMEYRLRRADGEYRWVLDSGTPFFSPNGAFCGYIGSCVDITERKRVEEQLDELRRQNELILNSAGEGICRVAPDGRCTFANPTAARMVGWEVDELVGGDFHAIAHHTRPDGSPYREGECPVSLALKDGNTRCVSDDVFWRKDGSSFAVEYVCTPIREHDHVAGAVVTFRDITERRSIDQMKDEFISVVGHELRTPLTSIRGALGLLASGHLGQLPAKSQRMLEVAVANTDRLVRLINDILDIERMESGQVSLRKQPCKALDLIEQALEVMRPLADKAGVTLLASSEPVCVEADPDGILQTLTNLLSNAIKFSRSCGTVSLTAWQQEGEVRFQVMDQGRGIPPQKIESIFGRFQQVDASDSRQRGGTGLGLAICRSIVQQHGGRIWAESQVGVGSTFFFTLPIGQELQPEAPTRHHVEKALVLVCDDDPLERSRARDLLERRGYRVTAVASGDEAVEQAVAQRPAAIVLDLMMPEMNGWETTAALKRREDTRNIPIIISSLLSPEESSQSPAHVTAWLRKPLEEGSLTQVLEMALQGQ